MLKKRLIAVVTIRNGLAVQSFGYKRYLPIGRPEVVVENLDRWGADEILLQCIDRSVGILSGPDFLTLEKISKTGLSTPLIYAGGIRHAEDAVKAMMEEAEKLMAVPSVQKAYEQFMLVAELTKDNTDGQSS